jgi:anti-sigma factor RsiW
MTGRIDPALVDRISAYLDGALPAAEVAELEALIARDPAVAAEVEALRGIDALLAKGFQEMLDRPVPLHLARAIEAEPRVSGSVASGSLAAFPGRMSGLSAIAASLVLIGIGAAGGMLVTRAMAPAVEVAVAEPGWLDDVAEYHAIYATQGRHLVEVPASELAHLETWLAEMTGVPFRAPDLSASGLTLEGGRLLVAAGKPVAQLMYRDAEGRVVAVCFKAGGGAVAGEGRTEFADRRIADLDLVSWKSRDAAFVVIGDAGRPDLRAIAEAASVAL